MAKQPRLPNIDELIGMGFDPKLADSMCSYLSARGSSIDRIGDIKKILRKNDRQQFVNRFRWENLPGDLDGELIERMLYYKYSVIFFYIPELNKFKVLPYVGKGLDEYGRYKECQPLPFNGKSDEDLVYLPGLTLKPIYDITQTGAPITEINMNGELETFNPMLEGCVIINSYCKDIAQKAIPEQMLIDPLLQMEAEVLPLARTHVFANSGVTGMRVMNQDEYSNVEMANDQLEAAAINGKRYVPIVGQLDFQEFENGGNAVTEEFFRYMQTLENIRLESYGLKNNGIYEKDQYVNNTMAGNIQANVGQIYQDCLRCRQNPVDIINAN